MTPYYADAAIAIYHGDCRDVLPTLTGVAATVTSPPYNTLGTRVPARATGMHASNGWLRKVRAKGYADDLDDAAYLSWQRDTAAAIYAATAPGGSFFYNHKVRYRDREPVHPIDIVRSFNGWALRQELIWDRCMAFAFNARMFAPSDERIYWLVRDGADPAWQQEAAAFLTVWRIPPVQNERDHPCPYPEELARRCILAATVVGDLVLDPYCGTGTTLVAAKRIGRRGVGIDVEERYCAIAAERVRQGVLSEMFD